MDAEAAELSKYLVTKLNQTDPSKRLLVGIAGIPASGKSSFAQLLVDHTNILLSEESFLAVYRGGDNLNFGPPQAILVALDGWHLTRAELDLFPNPKLAHDRRGIHWTFDGLGYVAFVRSLHAQLNNDTTIITASSFDHALKDPTPHAVSIHPYHRIVIIEGLYTFLSIEPWNQAGLLLDERWLIQVDIAKAQKRLVERHVITGVAKDREEAIWRAEENDMPNGRFILANMVEPTRIIESRDDPAVASLQ